MTTQLKWGSMLRELMKEVTLHRFLGQKEDYVPLRWHKLLDIWTYSWTTFCRRHAKALSAQSHHSTSGRQPGGRPCAVPGSLPDVLASATFYSSNIWLLKEENFRACASLPTPWEQRAQWWTFPQVPFRARRPRPRSASADTPAGRQSTVPGLCLVLRYHKDESSMWFYMRFKPSSQTNIQNLMSFKDKAMLLSFPHLSLQCGLKL